LFDELQVKRIVAAVELVADDRVPEPERVRADLMLASAGSKNVAAGEVPGPDRTAVFTTTLLVSSGPSG
jgi:hypothetical protein